MLVLEPEAATVHCRNKRKDLAFPPGTRYMVIDCGGETVNMVFHELDPKGILFSSFPSSLSFFLLCRAKYMVIDCGGETVNIVFHELDPKGILFSSFPSPFFLLAARSTLVTLKC
jgi:hypothetical protein